MDMKIVIPSKGRSEIILDASMKLFPTAFVTLDEEDVDAYSELIPGEQIILHPRFTSLAKIRNWIIDNIDAEIIFTPDDDIESCISMVGRNCVEYTDPDDVLQIVENAAYTAKKIGAGYFGFNQSARPFTFNPLDPINFQKWVGTACGTIGKELHYDENFSLHDDFDFSLTQLLKKRMVYRDSRFHFISKKRLRLTGGNTNFCSSEREQFERNLLKEKWGKYVSWNGNESLEGESINRSNAIFSNVKRRQ